MLGSAWTMQRQHGTSCRMRVLHHHQQLLEALQVAASHHRRKGSTGNSSSNCSSSKTNKWGAARKHSCLRHPRDRPQLGSSGPGGTRSRQRSSHARSCCRPKSTARGHPPAQRQQQQPQSLQQAPPACQVCQALLPPPALRLPVLRVTLLLVRKIVRRSACAHAASTP